MEGSLMPELNWVETVVVVFLLLCVLVGTLPVINTGLQFLVLPIHAFRNHYGRQLRTTPASPC